MGSSNVKKVVLQDIDHGGNTHFERVHGLLDDLAVDGINQLSERFALLKVHQAQAGDELPKLRHEHRCKVYDKEDIKYCVQDERLE